MDRKERIERAAIMMMASLGNSGSEFESLDELAHSAYLQAKALIRVVDEEEEKFEERTFSEFLDGRKAIEPIPQEEIQPSLRID